MLEEPNLQFSLDNEEIRSISLKGFPRKTPRKKTYPTLNLLFINYEFKPISLVHNEYFFIPNYISEAIW